MDVRALKSLQKFIMFPPSGPRTCRSRQVQASAGSSRLPLPQSSFGLRGVGPGAPASPLRCLADLADLRRRLRDRGLYLARVASGYVRGGTPSKTPNIGTCELELLQIIRPFPRVRKSPRWLHTPGLQRGFRGGTIMRKCPMRASRRAGDACMASSAAAHSSRVARAQRDTAWTEESQLGQWNLTYNHTYTYH